MIKRFFAWYDTRSYTETAYKVRFPLIFASFVFLTLDLGFVAVICWILWFLLWLRSIGQALLKRFE